jgi:putative RecB family exonuclease
MESDQSRKFSPSKLSTYEECPRRYQYRYVDKIKREGQSVEASSAPASIPLRSSTGAHARQERSVEETTAGFERAWEAGWSTAVKIRDERFTKDDWRKVGRDCIALYYKENQPFDRDRTVEVEKRIGFPLSAAGEECRIEGFIDRLALGSDGAFEIHDYKTGRSLPAQADVDADRQLAVYDAAVRFAWPDTKAVRLVWHYVRHGKTLVSTRTPAQLEALKAEIAALIERIRRDHEFAPQKSALCDWCEYRDICPLWSHALEIAKLPPEKARADAGVRLVGELALIESKKKELREHLKELEPRQKAVEASILAFAEKRGLMAVAGLDGEAVITEKEEYRFPTKSRAPEKLEALERELKGTAAWPEVSQLDSHRLLEAYKGKEWPAKLMEHIGRLLEKYAQRLREKTVRFRRKRDSEED